MVNFEEVFKHFGGRNKLCGAIDVSNSALSLWIGAGFIPPGSAVKIERLSNGKFKAVDLVNEDK